jgi:hypothetical protein
MIVDTISSIARASFALLFRRIVVRGRRRAVA